MTTPIMPAQAVLILFEDRTPMEHSAHLAHLLATDVHAAEAQIRAEMGFPAAMAERDYHPGQSGSRGFQYGKAFLSSESGASALDACNNPI